MRLFSSKRKDMTNGTPWKDLFAFAVPEFLTSLLSLLFATVDAFIIGRFIPECYAGVGDVGSVYSYIVLISNACAIGFSSVVASYVGKKDHDKVRQSVVKSLHFAMMAALLASVSFYFANKPLLGILGLSEAADAITYKSAYIYFEVLIIGFVVTILNAVLNGILKSFGEAKRSFVYMTIGSVTNVVSTLLLVIFLPTWEAKVAGAALATVLSQGVSALFSFVFLLRKFPYLRKPVRSDFTFSGAITNELISNSFPLMFQYLAVSISTFVISKSIISFDMVPGTEAMTDVQNGRNVAGKIYNIGCALTSSFASACMYFVGQNFGAGDKKRIQKGIRSALLLAWIASAVAIIFTVIVAWNGEFAYLILKESAVTERTKLMVHIFAMAFIMPLPFKVITDTCSRALVGVEKPTLPIIATFVEIPFRFLIVYGFRYWFFADPYSMDALVLMALAEPLTWIASAAVVGTGVLKVFYSRNSDQYLQMPAKRPETQ